MDTHAHFCLGGEAVVCTQQIKWQNPSGCASASFLTTQHIVVTRTGLSLIETCGVFIFLSVHHHQEWRTRCGFIIYSYPEKHTLISPTGASKHLRHVREAKLATSAEWRSPNVLGRVPGWKSLPASLQISLLSGLSAGSDLEWATHQCQRGLVYDIQTH